MNVAFIAHDAKEKTDAEPLHCLPQHSCAARSSMLPGRTGRLIEEATNLNVHKFLAGHIGGEETWRDDSNRIRLT